MLATFTSYLIILIQFELADTTINHPQQQQQQQHLLINITNNNNHIHI